MQHGLNKPLNSRQMKLLGLGFTPTSIGITGQEIKRAGRNNGPAYTNRAVTAGRKLQYVPVALKDADGNTVTVEVKQPDTGKMIKVPVHVLGKFKQIWHRN